MHLASESEIFFLYSLTIVRYLSEEKKKKTKQKKKKNEEDGNAFLLEESIFKNEE